MTVHCPKCDADVSDSYESDDHSVGIVGGYYCDACDIGIAEGDREPLEGDVQISFKDEPRPLGTPASELRGRPEFPGDPRYEEFCRIAKTWGYD